MATRAIKPKRDDSLLTGWQSIPEKAPSIVLEARSTWTRFLALVGMLFTAIGVLAQLLPEGKYRVSPGWGMVLMTLGIAFLLLHAFSERDEQFRKIYAGVGMFAICASALLRLLPGTSESYFLPIGIPGLAVGLLVVAAALRNETEEGWKTFLTRFLLVATCIILAGGVLLVSLYKQNYAAEGVLLMIVGLLYAGVTLSLLPDKIAYPAGVGMTLLGIFCLGEALIGCWAASTMDDFLVPAGFTLIVMGFIYFCVGLGTISEWQLVVLTRRELAGVFYSPVAYGVLFGMTLMAFYTFLTFLNRMGLEIADGGEVREPIVAMYIISFVPVIGQMFIVPILTMRLMSEEWRSGTLEVLLTAPVRDANVIISKFLAVWAFYMLTWVPFIVFLVSLRVYGGSEFDYRPMLSFGMAVASTGASFVAMGLFCSCLTRNQIIAAVFAFVGMIGYWVVLQFNGNPADRLPAGVRETLTTVSALNLWIDSVEGHLIPRLLVFHATAAVFFLFLSVKVLESRKWK